MSDARGPTDSPSVAYASRKTPRGVDRRSRERRANWIFIAIMVALTSPAVVITLVKFMRGEQSKRPLTPPAMRAQWAYMDVTPELSGIPRVTPPMTGSFVAAQAKRLLKLEPGLRSIVADGDFRAVMSDALHVQLIALGESDSGYRLGLIGWHDKFAPIPSLFTFTGHRADGTTDTGEMKAYESVNIPLDVREELQKYGYILPPSGVMWAIVYFDGTSPINRLDIAYNGNKTSMNDTLMIPPDVIDPFAPSPP